MKTPLLLLSVLAVLSAEAALVPAEVDFSQKHQEMVGFGTALIMWNTSVQQLYEEPSFIENYVQTMGNSLVRVQIYPDFEREVVADWRDIDRGDWEFRSDGGHRPEEAYQFIKDVYDNRIDEMYFIPTPWSPPGWMKYSGQTNGGNPETNKLRPEYYTHFAKYLAEFVLWFEETYGVPVHAISPQNELAFDEPYNSCIYTPEEFRDLVIEMGRMFEAMAIDVKIFGPEHMTHLWGESNQYVRAVMEDEEASQYLDAFAFHGYTDGIESDNSPRATTRLWGFIKGWGPPFWMTETSGEVASWDNETTGQMRLGALDGLAGKIHNSLVFADCAAWAYWQITDTKTAEQYALMELEEMTKKSYVQQHYAKYIRPGARRIQVDYDDENLELTAFVHEGNGTMTLVILNRTEEAHQLDATFLHEPGISSFEAYRTSATQNFANLPDVPVSNDTLSLTVPPRTITTLYTPGVDLSLSGWLEHDFLSWVYYYKGSTWAYHYDLGFVTMDNFPWIYVLGHGWLFAFSADEDNRWYYDLELGWVFTNPENQGQLWVLNTGEWIEIGE